MTVINPTFYVIIRNRYFETSLYNIPMNLKEMCIEFVGAININEFNAHNMRAYLLDNRVINKFQCKNDYEQIMKEYMLLAYTDIEQSKYAYSLKLKGRREHTAYDKEIMRKKNNIDRKLERHFQKLLKICYGDEDILNIVLENEEEPAILPVIVDSEEEPAILTVIVDSEEEPAILPIVIVDNGYNFYLPYITNTAIRDAIINAKF